MKQYSIPLLVTAPDLAAAQNAHKDIGACTSVVELATAGAVTVTVGEMAEYGPITGEHIAEAMRAAGMEVQYFPLHRLVPADQMKPHTMGSEDLNKIAAALNEHLKGDGA